MYTIETEINGQDTLMYLAGFGRRVFIGSARGRNLHEEAMGAQPNRREFSGVANELQVAHQALKLAQRQFDALAERIMRDKLLEDDGEDY